MASINEKLNYINETKSLIKDKLNDLGSEIDNETTFREYVEKIENLYEEWPKTSDTDTNITLNNTKKAKINMQLKGNTNQFTTTGKNLYYMSANDTINSDWNDVTIKSTHTGYEISGTASKTGAFTLIGRYITLPAGTYTFKLKKASALQISLSKTNYTGIVAIAAGSLSNTFTLEEETNVCLTLVIVNESSYDETNEVMIYNGTEENAFEPYTGGIPSPNPDYPQDIEVVTGENTINISGKNVLNCTQNEFTARGLTCSGDSQRIYINGTTTSSGKIDFNAHPFILPAGIYTFITEVESGTVSADNKINAYLYSTDRVGDSQVERINTNNKGTRVFTLRAPSTVYMHLYSQETNVVATNVVVKYMVVPGNVSGDYNFEPYQEPQTFLINLENLELCKINNYQDYIYKLNNKWYKKPIILKINSYNEETITTDYKSTTGALTTGATIYYINPNSNPDGIEITNTILINQLNALEQAISYNNQTSILQTNDDLPFIITASALLKNSN